jgi:hypothetical protein
MAIRKGSPQPSDREPVVVPGVTDEDPNTGRRISKPKKKRRGLARVTSRLRLK